MDSDEKADSFNFDVGQYAGAAANQPTPMFGTPGGDSSANIFGPDSGQDVDENDPKRRRIARVRIHTISPEGTSCRCG